MSGNQNDRRDRYDQRDHRLDIHFLNNRENQDRLSSPEGFLTGAPFGRATGSSTPTSTPNLVSSTPETPRTRATASFTANHTGNLGGKHSNWHKVMGNVQKCDFCEKRSPVGFLFGCYDCSLQVCPNCARLGKVYMAKKPHSIGLAGLGLIEPQVRPLVRRVAQLLTPRSQTPPQQLTVQQPVPEQQQQEQQQTPTNPVSPPRRPDLRPLVPKPTLTATQEASIQRPKRHVPDVQAPAPRNTMVGGLGTYHTFPKQAGRVSRVSETQVSLPRNQTRTPHTGASGPHRQMVQGSPDQQGRMSYIPENQAQWDTAQRTEALTPENRAPAPRGQNSQGSIVQGPRTYIPEPQEHTTPNIQVNRDHGSRALIPETRMSEPRRHTFQGPVAGASMPYLRPTNTNQRNPMPSVPTHQGSTAQRWKGQVTPGLSARETMARDMESRSRESAVLQQQRLPESRTPAARLFPDQRPTYQEPRKQRDSNAGSFGQMPYTPMSRGSSIQEFTPQPPTAQSNAWPQPHAGEQFSVIESYEAHGLPGRMSAFDEPRSPGPKVMSAARALSSLRQGVPAAVAPPAGPLPTGRGWETSGSGYQPQEDNKPPAWSDGPGGPGEISTRGGQYRLGNPREGHESQHGQAPSHPPAISPAEVLPQQRHPGCGQVPQHEGQHQDRHQDRQARFPEQSQPRRSDSRTQQRQQQTVERQVNVPGPAGFPQLSVRLRSAPYPTRSPKKSGNDNGKLRPRQPQPPQ